MTFGIEDYERSVARIFHENGKAVGTGFLVAPGYILTCTHVILQALNIGEDDFETAGSPEGKTIKLDFPLVGGNQITAKVVACEPYKIDSGDVAGLKLKSPVPARVKPLPMIRCTLDEIKDQHHAVYGFADDNGDRTDAYKPKSGAAGGRYQLYKAGDDPPDETIQAGFSGAPVWNYDRKGVIGMVATAAVSKEQRSKAYAISEEQLSPIIQELFARSLYDSICSHLEPARQQIQHVVETAFWLCDTDGNRAKSDDLLDRLLYLLSLSNREWQQDGRDIDRLTQLAMFLVVMDGLPRELVNEIATWVKCRSFDFDALYVRSNQYRQERQVPSTFASPHLIVQIRPDEQDVNNVYVSIWVVDDRDSADPLEPRPPLLQDEIVPFTALPTFLETWLQEKSDLDSPMIHCFVARHLLACDLDARETESELTLGIQYKLVMRTDLSQSPPGKQYYSRWKTKWQSFEDKQHSVARETFVRADCRSKKQLLFKQLDRVEMAILENLSPDRVDEVFKFIADKVALPIALWVRRNELGEELDRILDCTIINLPEKIRQERLNAETKTCLGSHLSLVWEDPKVIPPTMITPLTQ